MRKVLALMAILAFAESTLVITLSKSAETTFFSGNELYAICTSASERAECEGYVKGVLDVADFEGIFYHGRYNLHSFEGGPPHYIDEWCLPWGVTSRQTVDVVTIFLRDNPQIRHIRASTLVGQAMKKAFPCPQ
jgi:hypothetical protein